MKEIKSLIKLFKGMPIKKKSKGTPNEKILKKTIEKGFLFSAELFANYKENELLSYIDVVDEVLGLSAEQMNQSFHKSWNKVKESSIEQLFFEQIFHYITTYGYEKLGIYSEDSVYIPQEKLEIPELKDGLNLIVIKGYTNEEIKTKILTYIKSGIALKKETIDNILDILNDFEIEIKESDVSKIKNKEIRTRLYSKLNIIPLNETEFLRLLIYELTGNTLLIKDKETIESIKTSENIYKVSNLLDNYFEQYNPVLLSRIFLRYKPLFLAMKRTKNLNHKINRLRKLAKKHHRPIGISYLDDITNKISNGLKIDNLKLHNELDKVNIFRKIRLAYALKFRTSDSDSIMYRIRNGKAFAKEFNFKNINESKRVLKVVLDSIVSDISKKIKGKNIFMPDNIIYTLPSTEKQFCGYVPAGTYVTIKDDTVFGVHWENQNNNRIDLDLSLINISGKIGWDSSYRSEERDILFSGDITSAPKPKGATELFYVKRKSFGEHLLLLNYFNYDEDLPVPFKLFVASEKIKYIKRNYMVNPNNLLASLSTKIDKKEKVVGLLITTSKECRFYFIETNIGKSISSRSSEYIEHSRSYLKNYYNNSIKLKDVLDKSGAIFVNNKKEADIDLSFESLEKDTIINLLI